MGPTTVTFSYCINSRFLVIVAAAVAIAACSSPTKRAKRPAPPERPAAAAAEAGPPPNVSDCREYADSMAGRQMERDFDSMSGNFQGGNSQVFQDFARLDAQRYYRQLYESCLSQQRASEPDPATR